VLIGAAEETAMDDTTDHEVSREGEGPTDEDERTRSEAIKQIERRRHFHVELAGAAIGLIVLVAIWATSEYHNAGGWPTQGFSQSSGIHDVWNYWIVYPVIAVALVLGVRAWMVYGHKAITEDEIAREIERQGGGRSQGSRTGGALS
jgi:hypothetical protein